jgi:L-lactate dehydrogenase
MESLTVGIVGAGAVGAAAASAITLQGIATDLLLVDADRDRAEAEAADISHVTPFTAPVRLRAADVEELGPCRVIVITAGAAQRPGESRLDLMGRNAAVLDEVARGVLAVAPNAVLLVATNPVDLMTLVVHRLAEEAGVPEGHVFGTGTMLDTARFRQVIAARLRLDPQHVHGYVVGEHGDSEVPVWSSLDVGGRPLLEICRALDVPWGPEHQREVEDEVIHAAARIIAGKGATAYGVAAAIARTVRVVVRGQRSILTVSAWDQEAGCAYSLPRIVTDGGVEKTGGVALDETERERLAASAEILRRSAQGL